MLDQDELRERLEAERAPFRDTEIRRGDVWSAAPYGTMMQVRIGRKDKSIKGVWTEGDKFNETRTEPASTVWLKVTLDSDTKKILEGRHGLGPRPSIVLGNSPHGWQCAIVPGFGVYDEEDREKHSDLPRLLIGYPPAEREKYHATCGRYEFWKVWSIPIRGTSTSDGFIPLPGPELIARKWHLNDPHLTNVTEPTSRSVRTARRLLAEVLGLREPSGWGPRNDHRPLYRQGDLVEVQFTPGKAWVPCVVASSDLLSKTWDRVVVVLQTVEFQDRHTRTPRDRWLVPISIPDGRHRRSVHICMLRGITKPPCIRPMTGRPRCAEFDDEIMPRLEWLYGCP